MVLLDYANVPSSALRRGVADLVGRVLTVLPPEALPHGLRVVCRLYGGWYEGRGLSKEAQELAGAIRAAFPVAVRLGPPAHGRAVQVSVELARSLRIAPNHDLHHTFRRRGAPRGLVAHSLPFVDCLRPRHCPLEPVHHLLASGLCPEPSCEIGVSGVFRRAEQKLVDTMLTADLIQISRPGSSHIVVVTNDDDIWPGIYTAVNQGAVVHHIRPTPSVRHWPYASAVPKGYYEYSLARAAS